MAPHSPPSHAFPASAPALCGISSDPNGGARGTVTANTGAIGDADMASSAIPSDSAAPPATPPPRLPDGLVRHDAATLSHASALELFKRDQLLLLKLDAHIGGALDDQAAPMEFGWGVLREIYAKHPAVFSSCWCVENAEHMANGKDDLTPAKLLGVAATAPPPTGPFYVSTILQEDPEALNTFFKNLPFEQPPLLAGKRHDESCWLFLGVNPERGRGGGRRPRKRKRAETAAATGAAAAAAAAGAAVVAANVQKSYSCRE